MRHLHSGRKLGVNHSHRIALLRSLAVSLIEEDGIKTTPARAKELRPLAERLVTLAKRGDLASRRLAVRFLGSTKTQKGSTNRIRLALERLYSNLAPRFKTRNGGYTQIFRLSRRLGDNAEICLIRYLPEENKKEAKDKKQKVKTEAKDKPVIKVASKEKETAKAPQDKVVKVKSPEKAK